MKLSSTYKYKIVVEKLCLRSDLNAAAAVELLLADDDGDEVLLTSEMSTTLCRYNTQSIAINLWAHHNFVHLTNLGHSATFIAKIMSVPYCYYWSIMSYYMITAQVDVYCSRFIAVALCDDRFCSLICHIVAVSQTNQNLQCRSDSHEVTAAQSVSG